MDVEPYESRLVERFRRGDSRALETLFEMYVDRALSLASRLTKSREDAEEVVSEAFLRAFRHARQMTGGESGRFGPWLFAIVRNVAADKRRQLRLPTLSLEWADVLGAMSADDTSGEAIRRTERAELLAALDSLPEEQRTVLTLCDIEGVSHAEAAQVLDRSVAATKSLHYRARRALRNLLIES